MEERERERKRREIDREKKNYNILLILSFRINKLIVSLKKKKGKKRRYLREFILLKDIKQNNMLVLLI